MHRVKLEGNKQTQLTALIGTILLPFLLFAQWPCPGLRSVLQSRAPEIDPRKRISSFAALNMIFLRALCPIAYFPFQPANPIIQAQKRQTELAFSPPVYPSPWMNPSAEGWEDAYAKAKDFVSQMTLLEKVNLTTGVG